MFIILFGLFFVSVGIFFIVSQMFIRNNGVRTNAVVVDIIRHYDHDRRMRPLYSPVIEYNANGHTFKVEYPVRINYISYNIGQRVDIIYHKRKPDKIIIEIDKSILILIIICFLVGGVFLFFGLNVWEHINFLF